MTGKKEKPGKRINFCICAK